MRPDTRRSSQKPKPDGHGGGSREKEQERSRIPDGERRPDAIVAVIPINTTKAMAKSTIPESTEEIGITSRGK